MRLAGDASDSQHWRMKFAPLLATRYPQTIILCAAGLLSGTGVVAMAAVDGTPANAAGADAATDGTDRAHTIELGINDLRLRQENALPSIEDPSEALHQQPPCPLLEPSADCPARVKLDTAPATTGCSGSLHRLRRDIREGQETHDANHLIEDSLGRLANPITD
jgi:hypothetical protein